MTIVFQYTNEKREKNDNITGIPYSLPSQHYCVCHKSGTLFSRANVVVLL